MKRFSKWVYIFIFIGLICPVLSIESLIPWILFFLFSKKCIAIGYENIHEKHKFMKCSLYTTAFTLIVFSFNTILNKFLDYMIYLLI